MSNAGDFSGIFRITYTNLPSIWQTFDRRIIIVLHAAIALGRSTFARTWFESSANVHVRDQFFGNALQFAVVMMQTNSIWKLLIRRARMDPEGSEWDTIILVVGEGPYLNEGAKHTHLAVARLKLAWSVSEDEGHSEGSSSFVKQFV